MLAVMSYATPLCSALLLASLGMVDLVYVGRALIYASLVFSISSAVSYVRLFSAAVEAKEERQRGEG